MNTLKNIFTTAFIISFLGIYFKSEAQNKNLKECSSISTKQILLLKSPWAESENAASLSFLGCDSRIGSAYVYSKLENNDYHRYQEGDAVQKVGFLTDGFVKFNNWNFYGSFGYSSQVEKNVKWVGVMFPYDDNPYTMGDSIGGDYYKEFFNMEGKGSLFISDKISAGFDIKYLTADGAKRKDPRPENTYTSFDISPSIIMNFGKLKLGANFRYEGSKEDIEVSTVTSKTFYVFHFKGMGVYTSTSEYDYRSHVSDLLGGGLQFNFNNGRINNLTEINFYKKSTDIKRGETYPLQVVLLEKFNTNLRSTFIYSPSEKKLNKLALHFNNKHLYGHEPVIEAESSSVTYQWSTVAKYTLYWHEENEYGFDYSFYELTDCHHFNWGATISGQLNTSETTYYFVPEYNRQKLNIFTANATFEKGLQTNFANYVGTINCGYRKGFNGELTLVEDENLLETVNTDFVTHDFDYYNSGLLLFGASAKAGKDIFFYQKPIQLFAEAGIKSMISNFSGNPKSTLFELKIGMNF